MGWKPLIQKMSRGVVVKNILTEDNSVHQFNDAIVDRLNVGIVFHGKKTTHSSNV